MSFHKAIYEHLAGKSDVTTLCSTRIYHGRADETVSTVPYIVYKELAGTPTHYLGGDSGLPSVSFQIDCVDDDEAGAMALFDAVRKNLDSFAGTMGTGGDATRVRSTVLSQPVMNEIGQPGEGGPAWSATSTCEFNVIETAATP